jgi:diguanylate cyclase (GGDEF)-like protein
MTDERRSDESRATILVVDDSAAVRRIIGRTLTQSGYRVMEAADGSAALDVCRIERPDLMLLDIDMPVMDGPATLREMRAVPELHSVPVLFLTARIGADDVAAGLDLGAQDYLRKPCEPAELTARIARALRTRAHEEALSREARELSELSTTDPLTGLGNRRRMEATVDRMVAQHGEDVVLAVVLLDVDHFKAVNDTHGHAVGDTVLRIIAMRLRGAVDEQIHIARWGGEEFIVIGTGLDRAQAAGLAERLRKTVSTSPFAVGEAHTLTVTISGGCALTPAKAFADAVHAADNALYEAKRGGRDRIVVAPASDAT